MTNKKSPIKRFIAGATCPKCRRVDVLVMYKTEDETIRECVECGFAESQRFDFQQAELTNASK